MQKPKHRFYAPPAAFSGGRLVLGDEEARHAGKVLRLSPGDRILVVDGAGGTHEVELDIASAREVAGRVLHTEEGAGEPHSELHVALAVLHQPARWETFLEKAVELGCTRITPLLTARTQPGRLKRSRLENIMVSALKQSERSRLPVLDEPMPLAQILPLDGALRVICHEALEDGRVLTDLVTGQEGVAPGPRRVLIGPEGGFSDEEVRQALTAGWTPLWLGARRLRAETAAMLMASVLSQFDG
jgi:16S rRNA (uracil1498-N3)-methyltransferase